MILRRSAPEIRSVSRPATLSVTDRERRALVQRVLPVGVLALALLGVPWLLFASSGISRLDRLRVERETAELEISRLGKQIEELRVQVQDIKHDPDAVERVARDQLGLVRRTEVVFHFHK